MSPYQSPLKIGKRKIGTSRSDRTKAVKPTADLPTRCSVRLIGSKQKGNPVAALASCMKCPRGYFASIWTCRILVAATSPLSICSSWAVKRKRERKRLLGDMMRSGNRATRVYNVSDRLREKVER